MTDHELADALAERRDLIAAAIAQAIVYRNSVPFDLKSSIEAAPPRACESCYETVDHIVDILRDDDRKFGDRP